MAEAWSTPVKPWAECSAKRQEALYSAWQAGELGFKLDPTQKQIVTDIYASHPTAKSSMERLYILNLSRRSGKDWIMALLALQEAYRARKHIRIAYAAPTRDMCHEILVPTFEALFSDCPPELLPYEMRKGTFARSATDLNFDWGPHISLVGVDLHQERLRGTNTVCFFFTEPAFCDGLEHLMKSIILPQMLTNPTGFGVLGSTPPVTPGHFWATKMVPDAQLRKMYTKKTVYDNPRLDANQIRGAIEMCGGETSTQFQREYMSEFVTESTLAYIPEFASAKSVTVTEEPFKSLPAFRDTYVALDPGFAHATGCIFAFEDFENATLNIEGAFKTQGLNSSEVAQRIKAREWQLWGRAPNKPSKYTDAAWQDELELIRSHFYPGLTPPPHPVVTWLNGQPNTKTYRRVSDTDSRLIADLAREHDLMFFPTEKDSVELHRNALCLNIQRLRYRIHPRCAEVVADLEQSVWNRSRTKLAEQAGGGHFDCVSAMQYLNRNVTWSRNPFPPNSWDKHTHHVPAPANSSTKNTLLNMFRHGSKRR